MVFCRLLYETGARGGEAVKIEWQHINRENYTIHIAYPEKGSNERTVKVSRELINQIDSLPRKYGVHIFNPKLNTLRSSFMTQRKRISQKFDMPELEKIHMHTFRHIRGTFDVLNGVPLYEVKDKLGHKCITNTDKYVHWSKELCPERDDKYYTQSVATDEEADKLIEAGWQFVCVNPKSQRMHFRKAK